VASGARGSAMVARRPSRTAALAAVRDRRDRPGT
jgi:hypothetical protein